MLKLFLRLNMLERIALVLSSLYGIGVIAMLQYSALYLGFEKIDFLRIKPILVGVQYVIYVGLPILVFVSPIWVVMRIKARCIYRILIACLMMAVLFTLTGMMFHYFLPYAYMTNICGVPVDGFAVVLNVWCIYFHLGVHWIGFVALLMAAVISLANRGTRTLKISLVFIGVSSLFYPFNQDVYMNVSQGAGGGAPKAGIITIDDPCLPLKSGNVLYSVGAAEVSKPCFVLYEDSDSVLISEMFLNRKFLSTLNENSITRSITRYDKTKIRQFAPISYYQMWRSGDASIITNSLTGDVIHQLDFSVVGLLSPTNDINCISDMFAEYQTTNMPELVLWIDNDGCSRTRANHVSYTPSSGSNVVVHIEFTTVPISKGVQVWQWEQLMTTNCRNVGVRIDNLPHCPENYKWENLAMGFRCNFIHYIELSWPRVIVDNTKLFARKKACVCNKAEGDETLECPTNVTQDCLDEKEASVLHKKNQ